MRVAAVDQGTNTTRLLVADIEDGELEEVSKRVEITRLGEGVDARRRLLPVPITRVRNVLTGYRREAEQRGAERILLVATSAVRDAENGEAFLGEIEWSYGFVTRLLSGDEEAELTFRGAADGRIGSTLVIDPGGGSTEFVVGEAGEIRSARASTSARRASPSGSCTPTRRPRRNSRRPPTTSETPSPRRRRSIRPWASRARSPPWRRSTWGSTNRKAAEPTATGSPLTPCAPSASASLRCRSRNGLSPGLHPKRAPVIVAGAVLVEQVLDRFGIELVVSERDILHGAALEAATSPARRRGLHHLAPIPAARQTAGAEALPLDVLARK